MPLRAAELEVLYTANTAQVDKAQDKVKAGAQAIESKPVEQKIGGDASEALADIDRVTTSAKKLVSERAVLKVDADIERTEKSLQRARDKVEDLSIRAEAGFEVTAETKRAEASVARLQQQAERLATLRATIDVDASTLKAETELDQLADKAAAAGAEAGQKGGGSLSEGLDAATRGAGERVGRVVGGDIEGTLVDALTAIPIAGGIILAGVAIGKTITGAIQDGLQQEVGFDRLEALTGLDPATALRIGRQAGEAYANVFGDSVEANLDTARLAVQFNILDADATNAEAKRTIEGLAGIADVMRDDVQPVATATTTLLRTGLAQSAQQAFDLIAAGEREGANRAGDLLDTLTEYPALFQRLGLTGPESLGLISQALEGGARNSDLAADALKEFQIRATDASTTSAAGFETLGLNAEEMTAKIARGGQDARDGLDLVLDRLRETEDPVLRNAAAVALFGTQAEDLGAALFNMDLTNAVEQLGQVEGAAQRMFDTLADNDATKLEQAQRNVEVAMDGIKGALAAGFSEPLGEAAEWVSQNRGPVLQFFLDLANGALDFGDTVVEGVAVGTEAFGDFVSGPLADSLEGIASLMRVLQQHDAADGLQEMVDGMRDFDKTTDITASTIRAGLGGALDDARTRLNDFAEPAVALGYLNDASLRLAEAVGEVGVMADGTRASLEGVDLANLSASESGAMLEGQIRGAIAALSDEITAADAAGESQGELRDRYLSGRDALIAQMEQMGLTREQAQALIDTVMATPESATTEFGSNAPTEQQKVQNLADRITTLPDGTVVVNADVSPAEQAISKMYTAWNGKRVRMDLQAEVGPAPTGIRAVGGYHGGVVDFMARGGIPDLTPMNSTAAVIPANTWRVVGDRGDVAESFIPLDGSARSMAILAETIRRMPGLEFSGAPTDAMPSLEGLTIAGRLRLDADGFVQLIDGRIISAQHESGMSLAGGESSL